jgi:hypothetical protein
MPIIFFCASLILPGMIRLALRTLFATTKESLVEISEQVVELYRDRSRSQRAVVPESFGVSIPCTQMEFAAILNSLVQTQPQPVSTLDAVGFCFGLPFIITFMDDGSPMQIRVIIDLLLWVIPLHSHFASALSQIGLPCGDSVFARIFAGALLHVLSIQISHRQSLEFVPVIFRTVAVSGLLHGASTLIRGYLARSIPFIPEETWSVVFAMLFDTLIQRLVRFGLMSTVEWAVEKVITVFFKLVRTELADLPDAYDVPPSLACPICVQVLKNPVVVLGSLVCEDCLERWMAISARNPCTGEPIGAELVEQSVLMTLVADKWHRLALAEVRN